jgi:hypothetical protein
MTRARWMPLALAFGLAAVAAGRGDLELAHGPRDLAEDSAPCHRGDAFARRGRLWRLRGDEQDEEHHRDNPGSPHGTLLSDSTTR